MHRLLTAVRRWFTLYVLRRYWVTLSVGDGATLKDGMVRADTDLVCIDGAEIVRVVRIDGNTITLERNV